MLQNFKSEYGNKYEQLNVAERLWLAIVFLEETLSEVDPEDALEIRGELTKYQEAGSGLDNMEKIEYVKTVMQSLDTADLTVKADLGSICRNVVNANSTESRSREVFNFSALAQSVYNSGNYASLSQYFGLDPYEDTDISELVGDLESAASLYAIGLSNTDIHIEQFCEAASAICDLWD